MVSPCLESMINNGANDVRFSKIAHRGIVENAAPPPEFQFSAEAVKVCGQPKHCRGRRSNGLTSNARRLGNVRPTLLNSGSEEVFFVRKNLTTLSPSNATETDYLNKTADGRTKKSTATAKWMSMIEGDPTKTGDIHFAAKNEVERRRKMAATLNAMLGSSPVRRNSLRRKSLTGFHEQQVADARNDPYQIHKWRRKSSRKKYAGMHASPTIAMQETRPHDNAEDRARKRSIGLADDAVGYHQDFTKKDYPRKPRVPLPGGNMLPTLNVHNRSETGASGRQEVTFKFARNVAMEELERRFHDDRWKTKGTRKATKKHSLEQQSLADLSRETRRTNVLRHAASMRLGGQREQEEIRKNSTMQTLDILQESPDKSFGMNDQISEIPTPDPPGTSALSPISTWDIPAMKANEGHHPSTNAVRFTMIKDSLSEETVTIVSKPSEAISPSKRSTPGYSKASLILSSATGDIGTEGDTSATTTKAKQQKEAYLLTQPANRKAERKFPRLPDFPKSGGNKYQKSASIFSHLQQNMSRENEQQYRKFSRSTHSVEQDEQHRKVRGKRVTLPPLTNTGSKQNEYFVTKAEKRKYKISDTDRLNKGDSLSPLGSSPIRRKVVNSTKLSPLSYASSGTHPKDSLTPVDSIGSQRSRRRSKNWKQRSTRGGLKESPQFQMAQKQTKMAKLMGKWKTAIRLTILFNRLCNDHHMVTDDSYNIHMTRSGGFLSGVNSKQEVLFDVTDYKMKNQQKLSETTRRILSMPPEERTDQDVRMVQTTLRNLKAISDHSASVQSNIGRSGYFVGFESKRVVVLENRRPLNFYVLLAGSAVVIKEDEKGNTNPISFMKRGDVFGEREILDNASWKSSVVTVDPCEFLLLDKSDYMRIFLAGGTRGLLDDPDRGTFLKNLSLFQEWPTQLLDSNPNRCLFRYYKRGALLARDATESEWIFVIKSGSCSVLKPLRVQSLTPEQIFRKQLEEQTAVFPAHLKPHLVEKEEVVTEEEHLQTLDDISEAIKAEKVSVATSYHQIEMASLLKELNIEINNGILTPLDEEDEEDVGENDTMKTSNDNKIPISITEGEIDPYINGNTSNGQFRMSRVSDRAGPPRTPSPMKAAYLQTGISSPEKEYSQRKLNEGNLRNKHREATPVPANTELEIDERTENETTVTDAVSAEDFLSKLDTTSLSDDAHPPVPRDELKPVYINIRRLTKGSSFGLDSILFNDQPNLALVSNGAECLVLHKKFYLDNMTDDVLKKLREAEHPYPTESELMEDYWRLISWKAFQQRTMQGIFRRRALVKQYLNPPKTGVH